MKRSIRIHAIVWAACALLAPVACAQFDSEPGYLGFLLTGGSGGGSGGASGTTDTTIAVSVQTGTLTIAGDGTDGTFQETATISAVDTSSSFLIFQARHNSNRPPASVVRGVLLDSTTVQFTKITDETSVMTIRWYVVSYPSGYISVESGTANQTTVPLDTAITDVGSTAQAFVLWSKAGGSTFTDWSADDPVTMRLTSSSNLRLNAGGNQAVMDAAYQVVRFLDSSLINVQSGTNAMAGVTNATSGLGSAVDTSRTILLADFYTDGGGADVGSRLLRARFQDASTVAFDRGSTGSPDNLTEIAYQAIQFNDGSSIQSGTASFTAGQGSQNIAIGSVDTGASVALLSTQCGAGQNAGASTYVGDDIVGVSSFTTTLSSTQLTLTRDSTAGDADVAWYVIQFGK